MFVFPLRMRHLIHLITDLARPFFHQLVPSAPTPPTLPRLWRSRADRPSSSLHSDSPESPSAKADPRFCLFSGSRPATPQPLARSFQLVCVCCSPYDRCRCLLCHSSSPWSRHAHPRHLLRPVWPADALHCAHGRTLGSRLRSPCVHQRSPSRPNHPRQCRSGY